ncbi:hypothetical protein ACQ33O_03675 [Ferruginibacter sp. SUN002]|uniref:hypothetical protein n=1 Tax=Ferruginibacter sp. SUN002 TaxID=2937789 RepID=UPI003D36DB40
MRKIFLLVFTATIAINVFAQNNSASDAGWQIETGWQKLTRSEFNTYLGTISDTLDLASPLSASPGEFNVGISGLVAGKHVGFEAGASYGRSFGKTLQDNGHTAAGRMNLTTFNLRLGPNFILNKNFYIGTQLMVSSTDIQLDVESINSATKSRFESTDESNPFRAINFMVRFQTAFCIPTSKKINNTFKIIPFYDLSISKHNFYKASDNVLIGYSGKHSSSVNGYGFRLAYFFAKKS